MKGTGKAATGVVVSMLAGPAVLVGGSRIPLPVVFFQSKRQIEPPLNPAWNTSQVLNL
jgi:hypothetical protein